MNRQAFLELSDLDKLKHLIEESLKSHDKYLANPYWRGSKAMGENILSAMESLKDSS